MAKRIKYSLTDAFETKSDAKRSAEDLRQSGFRVSVRKIPPQGGYGGRLKYGVFDGGRRKKQMNR